MRISDWSSDVCSSDLDLAEIAAFLPRTAVREFPCHVGERLRALQDSRQCRLRPRLGLRRRLRIGRIGGEEDVGALIKILAAEAPKIVLVVAPAGPLVGLRCPDLAPDPCPAQRPPQPPPGPSAASPGPGPTRP